MGKPTDINLYDDLKSLWLKKVLTENHVTATELARRLDVKPSTVTRWLRRDWKDSQRITGLKKHHFLAICYVLGLKYEDFEKEWDLLN